MTRLGPRLSRSLPISEFHSTCQDLFYEFSPSSSSTRHSIVADIKAVAESFDHGKFCNFRYVQLLYQRLSLFASMRYYAPYTAVINASMTGKSRMLAELRHQGVFLFTICLRPAAEGAGYRPLRTPGISDWATMSLYIHTRFVHSLLFALKAFFTGCEVKGTPFRLIKLLPS